MSQEPLNQQNTAEHVSRNSLSKSNQSINLTHPSSSQADHDAANYVDKNDNYSNESAKITVTLLKQLQQDFIADIKPLTEISEIKPRGYIVELGSNQKASQHLSQSRAALEAQAISFHWSTEYINPDYTATVDNPKLDYTNQCGYLMIKQGEGQSLCLGELVRASKIIEKTIQQNFYEAKKLNELDVDSLLQSITEPKNRVVIIDIDILAIITDSGQVIAVEERYPFKHHEWVGLAELYNRLWKG